MTTAIDMFNTVFQTHTIESDNLLINIIMDRNYDIPDWVYPYITEDVLVSILCNVEKTEELKTFIKNVIQNCKLNQKYLTLLCLEDSRLFQYAFIVKPKRFYKYARYTIKTTEFDVIKLIFSYIEFYDTIAPKYYYFLLNNKNVMFGEDHKSFKDVIKVLKTRYGMYKYDLYFKGGYYAFEYIFDQYANKGETHPCLIEYWESGGSFIPDNLPLSSYKSYIEIVSKKSHFPKFSNDLAVALNRNKRLVEADVDFKTDIMDTVRNNIVNVNLLVWDLTEEEKVYVKDIYSTYHKKNIKDMDFLKYYNLIQPGVEYVPFSVCRSFIEKGGKIDLSRISIDDIDGFINCIMKNLTEEELVDIFQKDVNVSMFNNKISLLKWIVDEYIIKNKDVYIHNRFYSIVLNHIELLDLLIEKDYMDYIEFINQYSTNVIQLLTSYPVLIKYQETLPAVIMYSILSSNPSAIDYIPWNYLPENMILNRITSKGYFPILIKEENDSNFNREPAKYVSTQKLLNIMKTGNGLGYCLDYSIPDYVKTIFQVLLGSEN